MEGQTEVKTTDLEPSTEAGEGSSELISPDASHQGHIEVNCEIKDPNLVSVEQVSESEAHVEFTGEPVDPNLDSLEQEPKEHVQPPNQEKPDCKEVPNTVTKPSDVGSEAVTETVVPGSELFDDRLKETSLEVTFPDPSWRGLVFKGVSVTLGDTSNLQDVSGMSGEGKLLAIMGPSGAGKTTLLNTLSGRLPVTTGQISLNGIHISKKTKRKICYVLQEDIFFPCLTLRDTLTFAASIRLPDTLSHDQKMSRLDEIIDSLELRKCLDTPMGGPMMPGLSGGERKRANIACELLTDPSLILLDEPTTGLDSSSAANLMKTMKNYATSHSKVIVATIHQPSSTLFYSFDNLLLLCGGQTAYYGLTADVVQYFRSIHFPVQPGFNPADFILDKMKNSTIVQQQIIESCKDLRRSEKWPQVLRGKAQDNMYLEEDEPESLSMLKRFPSPDTKKKYRSLWTRWFSKGASKTEGDVGASLMDLEENVVDSNTPKFLTSFFTQYKHLTIRTFKQSRPRILDKLKLLENVVICAVFSLIWFQLPRTEDTLRDRMGAIFFIAIHWGFMPFFDATSSFPMEQVVIYKERASGWYRLSAYYLAKMTSELPLIFAQPLFFLVVAYWVVGFNGAVAFFATIGTVFINSLAGQSIGLFLGILSKEMRQAITMSMLVQMSIMLLGGLFTRNLPFWLDWLKYLSFLHYSFHCLMVIEFQNGPPIQCSSNRNMSIFVGCQDPNTTSVPSHLALEYFDVTWDFWQYFIQLFTFIIFFRILGYLMLRFVNKPD
ncbi:ABC transporter G family member 9-like [Mizuhopecten yessoensis]|uniref:ABC transporter G family member 9-like n=1 Tax=Mizuhopecten yessoensis TaxID=6573 RepID=UPI000B45B1DA|nr:ABC transporter G family member 9-like [Mizuhopecten yessoensis]XP_021345190.1 ABC transporter G family member 9-like [Mizuhopecten yessoensis]